MTKTICAVPHCEKVPTVALRGNTYCSPHARDLEFTKMSRSWGQRAGY
jgi:hypothetical protein